MRVAFISRSTLFSVPGGDTIQVMEIVRHLNRLGIQASIKLSCEIVDYDEFDLLHFINLARPADLLHHLKKANKPFVVSTNFVDYSSYDMHNRKGISGLLFKQLSVDGTEYCKTVFRWTTGKDKLSSVSYLWKGQRKCISEILNKTNRIFPNSKSEYFAIANTYQIFPAYTVIPNGINKDLFRIDKSIKKDALMVICVARIEGIKNQLNLIKALNNTKYRIFIIGKAAPNQLSYFEECKKMAASNIEFVGHLPQNDLLPYYQKAKVHILPSWFETTGLSSLEAAAMGCNIVVTDQGYTRDYFQEDATYCEPGCPESIFSAVTVASELPCNKSLMKRISSNYTWEKVSSQLANWHIKHKGNT
jgi:glycosyltransferase involved in cell wall biosynthesis